MRGFHGSMSGWRRAIGAALRDAGRLVLAGWLSTLTSLGPLPAAAAGQPEAPAAGPTLVFLPLVASQSMSTSKMPTLLEGRAAAVLAALGDAGPGGALSAQTVADLSDYLLHVSPAGELLVEFHARGAVGASEKAELAARGARVVSSTGDLRWPAGVSAPAGLGVIAAWVPAAQVADLARLAWVAAVRPAEHTPADVGGSLSEGVALHNADDVQTAGVDGAGVSVGVISDGVSNLAAAQGSNDLPAGVTVLSTGSGDEGTAMLEIVHDMAPGAALVFAATGGGVANHIAAQTALVAAGVDLIAEDIPFDGEPVFQKGSAAVSGDNIAGAGVGMHSSAGNLGQSHAARVVAAGTGAGPDGFNGPFTGCAVNPANAVAIAPGGDTTFDVMLGNSTSFTLQWSEPRAIFPTAGAGGFTNLDLFLMNAAGTTCLAQSTAVQGNGAGDTIEQLTTGAGLNGTAAKIVVSVTGVNGAAAAPTLDLRWRGASATDAATQAGSLNPDSNYTGLATAAGAVNAGASTNPAAVGLEGFSGGGPVQLFSTTVCPGAYPCPGAAVAGPAVVTAGAPAWAAADGVDVSGAGGFSDPFFGTSAAAPSAAGCEALVREHLGAGATVAAVNARLAATATDRGPAGVDNLWGAGVLDCRRAILPTANIGGPYNTPEGTDRVLNASASSDPDGDALTFSWDFNNDGVFGDAAGATPVFDRVGQDGVFPIAVRVSDPGGLTDTAAGVVVVTNVAPTVSLNSDAPRPENSVVTVLGQVSDPGWLDPLSTAILWGDGTPAEPVVGVLENVRPDATLTFAATHTYGDNGTFTASICASDDDVATCQSIALTIDNVAPAATLDTTGAFIINGQPTFVVEAGDPQAFSLRWQDPGSDDLTLTWDWDDGAPAPDVVTTSLVNPPAADPLPSPSLQPRDVIDAAVQTFSAPCLYQVGFSAADDDGGSAAGSVVVLVTGDDDEAEAAGIDDNSEAKERCYVKIIAYASQVFDEVHVLTKLDDDHPSGNEMLDEFDHVLVETWLKFATGEVGYGLAFDLDEDGVAEGTFGSLITAAEAVRLNPAATAAELRHQMKIMDHLSN